MAATVLKVVQAEHDWNDLAALDWEAPGYSALKSWEDTQLYTLYGAADEGLAVAEAKALKATQAVTEVVGISEARRNSFYLLRAYDVAYSEALAKTQRKVSPEALSVIEQRGNSLKKTFSEAFRVAEARGNSLKKTFSEAFRVAEARAYSAIAALSEALGVQELYTDQTEFVLRASESLLISDGHATEFTKQLVDAFAVVDSIVKRATLSEFESVNYDEAAAQIATFVRKVVETLEVEDSTAKTGKLAKADRVSLLERFIRNANAVVGDLQFFEESFGEAEFIAQVQASPAGFTPFKEFLAGEHTFSEALFKTSLVAAASLARPRMTELTVKVDVPDVTEQGSATVPVAGVQITFGKQFYVPPTIKVVVSSGTVLCMPRLYNETVAGFFVKLEALASPGTYVAGTITWSAEGY